MKSQLSLKLARWMRRNLVMLIAGLGTKRVWASFLGSSMQLPASSSCQRGDSPSKSLISCTSELEIVPGGQNPRDGMFTLCIMKLDVAGLDN